MYEIFLWLTNDRFTEAKFKARFVIISIDRMLIYAWPAIIAGDYCIKLSRTHGELRFDYSTVSFAFICDYKINFYTRMPFIVIRPR